MNDLIFTSIIFPGSRVEIDSLLLAESIRSFGGTLANNPIWFNMPDCGKPLSGYAERRLKELNVSVIPFSIEAKSTDIFFMEQLAGLELIEKLGEEETELLAWMDANTLLLNEPGELILPPGKSFGYRPVHHLLLGSRYDQPLDPFWTHIYEGCQVPAERAFPMRPVVEDLQMRPYFNAGLIVTRPQRKLLRAWQDTFMRLYNLPEFQMFYQQDRRYSIFMHQAVLAGTVLNHLELQEILELPPTYNYPIHLYDKDKTQHRPSGMERLTTARHEGFYADPAWKDKIPAGDELKEWLEKKLRDIAAEI